MTARGYIRGHPVFYIDNEWRYSDGVIVNGNTNCTRCGKPPTKEGYDTCLGKIPGVTSACCGHGVEAPYLVFGNGRRCYMKEELAEEVRGGWE